MSYENLVKNAIEYITDIFRNNADGHDLNHSLRVYKNAMNIAEVYPEADKLVISLAALLHDVDDHKLFQTENNENARRFLEKHIVEDVKLQNEEKDRPGQIHDDSEILGESRIEKICTAINSVSFSKNKGLRPDSIEGCIVQDADRLDALGAIGIARTFAYGGKHGRSIEESAEHFYEKLLLLKDQMNTEEAKRIAEERHKFLLQYIDELKKEISL